MKDRPRIVTLLYCCKNSRGVDNEGGCRCVGGGVVWIIFVPSSQFFHDPKTWWYMPVILRQEDSEF
jgi:hypothetical protein